MCGFLFSLSDLSAFQVALRCFQALSRPLLYISFIETEYCYQKMRWVRWRLLLVRCLFVWLCFSSERPEMAGGITRTIVFCFISSFTILCFVFCFLTREEILSVSPWQLKSSLNDCATLFVVHPSFVFLNVFCFS